MSPLSSWCSARPTTQMETDSLRAVLFSYIHPNLLLPGSNFLSLSVCPPTLLFLKLYQLNHTFSMVNLHEEPPWHFNRGPPSPTASSVSSTTSRSATPTTSNNPWSSIMTSPSSTNSSPKESPNRTPQYHSRSATPVAPQPMRPINLSTGFVPMSPQSMSGESLRGSEYPGSPPNFPGSPNPYRQSMVSLPPLNGFVTPAVLTQYQRLYPDLLRRQGLEKGTQQRAYLWALSNPKTALLLGLCDDIASWPKAVIFGLSDTNMPFSEADLHGIAANPRKAIDTQWQVTSKELPQNGSHVEFNFRETVPLQQLHVVRSSGSPEKSIDRVRFLGGSDDRIYIRKRLIFTRPSQKATLMKQIQDFKQLEHKNLAKIVCSYSQPSVIGLVSAASQYTLDDYLSTQGDLNRPRQLLDWMNDLSQALEYLHAQSITHRSIRPRKILIDGNRIYLAPFGIGTHHDGPSPTVVTPQRLDQLSSYFQDQSYIYAAPEALVSRGKKPGRPADVFSLGCVFLSMMTVVQNQSLSAFTEWRASGTQDASFHANFERVASWRARLYAAATSVTRGGSVGMGRKEQQLRLEKFLLELIERMIRSDPSERVKMRKLVPFLAKWGDGKGMGGRRRSSGWEWQPGSRWEWKQFTAGD
ncbi:kinase-like protein [Delitschia confertaspora ATCC 74209]|uniref:Kinase-like protein n=1 Tax=Delitschia confertaspora ATCC 74209 TaxID=1513339 RepID=A0A9P4JEX8_9PLEO|nr:kinase-like protein [Delitschia confertaspora ATCC 74209]